MKNLSHSVPIRESLTEENGHPSLSMRGQIQRSKTSDGIVGKKLFALSISAGSGIPTSSVN
jgi:hypothetical protein